MSDRLTRPEKPKRKFVVIVKIDSTNFVKYRCNDLQNFFGKFLLKKFPLSRFANVYCNKGMNKGRLEYTWGSKKGLQPACKTASG